MASQYKRVFVNSEDRVSGTPASFQVQLTQPIPNVTHIGACQLVMPNSLHNVSSEENTLEFTKNGAPTTITVDPGYYTPDTLKDELNTKSTASHSLTWTTDDTTRSFFGTYAGAGDAIITGGTMLDILGMEAGQTATNGGAVWETAAGKAWDLSGEQEIFLTMPGSGVGGTITHKDLDKRDMPILSRVVVDVPSGEMIRKLDELHDYEMIRLKSGSSLKQNLEFRLTDRHNNPLNLRENTAVSFTLVLRIAS